MLFAKALAVGASFIGAALAQSKIQFTTLPTAVEAGVPIDLKWINGDNSPVTITLKQGDPDDLEDVDVITTTGKGGSFTWTPSKSLPDGDDYALQISQGSDINFTGQFSISGGSGSEPSASATDSSSASITKSSSASITSHATTVSITSSQKSTLVVTSKIPLNATVPAAGTGTGASFGTSGIPITRNATLSRATLTATKSSAASSSAAGSGGAGGAGGSSTGSKPSSTTGAPGSNSAANLASPLALVLCALVAVVYLG